LQTTYAGGWGDPKNPATATIPCSITITVVYDSNSGTSMVLADFQSFTIPWAFLYNSFPLGNAVPNATTPTGKILCTTGGSYDCRGEIAFATYVQASGTIPDAVFPQFLMEVVLFEMPWELTSAPTPPANLTRFLLRIGLDASDTLGFSLIVVDPQVWTVNGLTPPAGYPSYFAGGLSFNTMTIPWMANQMCNMNSTGSCGLFATS
jgi:hypothetical protein